MALALKRKFSWLLGAVVLVSVAVFIEVANQKPKEKAAPEIKVRVVSADSVYFDTIGFFSNRNQGSAYIKVDYADIANQRNEIISRIVLSGVVRHGDGTVETFNSDCYRRGSNRLDDLPHVARNIFSNEIDHDPICFVALNHSVTYEGAIVPYGSEPRERISYVREVAASGGVILEDASVWSRKRPTVLQGWVVGILSTGWEAAIYPFARR